MFRKLAEIWRKFDEAVMNSPESFWIPLSIKLVACWRKLVYCWRRYNEACTRFGCWIHRAFCKRSPLPSCPVPETRPPKKVRKLIKKQRKAREKQALVQAELSRRIRNAILLGIATDRYFR